MCVNSSPSASRRNNFDFLRFCFATLVIASHSFILFSPGIANDPLYSLSHGQLFSGRIAVFAFFALSGYLITLSWLKKPELRDFFKKRVLRIYPGFIAAYLISVFVVAPIGTEQPMRYLRGVSPVWTVKELATLRMPPFDQRLFPTQLAHLVNGSMWSIAPEFLCYILIAACGMLGILTKRRAFIALFTALFAFSLLELLWPIEFLSTHLLNGIIIETDLIPVVPVFLSGAICALYNIHLTNRQAALCVVLLLFALFIPHGVAAIYPLVLAPLLLWLAYVPNLKMQNWSQWVGGDYSYGLYLYSFPIQQLLIRYVPAARHVMPLFALSFPLSLLAALCSWRLIEKPFLRLKANHASSSPSGSA